MLYAVGPLQYDIAPLNVHETDRTAAADYVDKKVIGVPPVYEHVGDGEDQFTLRGRLFPFKLGGLGALQVADMLRKSGAPQMVVRGDGAVLGWYIVTQISEKAEYLNAQGVGQMIGHSMELKKAGAPTAAGYFAALFGLLP